MPTDAQITVTRRPERFSSDDKRVIAKYFPIGGEDRILRVIGRVMSLSEHEVNTELERVTDSFGARHRNLNSIFERHFYYIQHHIDRPEELPENRKLLIGAYFTMEYSIESAALFNPSIVLHPDQSGVEDGCAKFIMSLRATGEGHVSSIVFRTGVLHPNGHVVFDPPPRFAAKMRVTADRRFEKKLFFLKLIEMAAYNETARIILDELDDNFTYEQLSHKISEVRERPERPSPFTETAENMLWLARSNYHLHTPPDTDPSEIVIFPTSENESRGIEDVRLTRFTEDNGEVNYFGTYTAYNGYRILPQLLETRNFTDFEVHTLNGKYVQNKGMALFPRRIEGQYAMIGRLDGENMYLMRSDNVHFWNECELLQTPVYPWEFIQIGNCGPPIETDAGWLLLTHGVGSVRQYCIGASLLDKDDPSRIIGHLKYPLIVPNEDERDGYVPNVVYSCGAIAWAGHLVIPYAMSDSATTFATVELDTLIGQMLDNGPLPEPDDPRRERRKQVRIGSNGQPVPEPA